MSVSAYLRLLFNPKVLVILFLGFASGLPMALTASTLTAWYTEAGASMVTLGLLSLVGQPYVYKFLWSPILDRYSVPILGRFLGRRRSWMLLTQIALIAAIVSMAFFNPTDNPKLLAGLAFLVAFLSATQDIAINAYQTDIADEKIRGIIAAYSITGWRIAILISGSLALIMAQYLGWHATYLIMSAFMLLGIITTWFAPIPEQDQLTSKATSLQEIFVAPMREFINRNGLWISIALILTMMLYKLGDAFALSLNTPFLLKGLHFSLAEVGSVNKMVGMISSIVGGIVGGLYMARLGLFRALIIFGVIQNLGNFAFMWLAHIGHNYPGMVFAIFCENFTGGLGNTAFVAAIMALCNKQFSASQFAVLTALTSVGRVYVGYPAALMVEHLGWMWFYFGTVLIGIPGIIAVLFCRRHIPQH